MILFQQFIYRIYIQVMLHGMYRRRKLIDVVTLVRHGTLRYDAAAVESLVYIMYRGTENLDAELQSLFYGMRALE